jgi:transcriptional regulator with GAF, ATPase, and Fis domain
MGDRTTANDCINESATERDDAAITADLTRYRALLNISGTVGAQPTVHAVLHSLAALLSNVVAFDHAALLVRFFGPTPDSACLREQSRSFCDRSRHRIRCAGTDLGRALKEQVPVFVPDLKQELVVYPELASPVNQAESAYIFPISTPRTKLGALVFATGEIWA